jgi:hypothetical protein
MLLLLRRSRPSGTRLGSGGTGLRLHIFMWYTGFVKDQIKEIKEQINVTLSVPGTLLRRFRVFAAARNQSMSSLMTVAIRQMIEQDAQTGKAKRRFLERVRNAPDRGTNGVIAWTRDELHER